MNHVIYIFYELSRANRISALCDVIHEIYGYIAVGKQKADVWRGAQGNPALLFAFSEKHFQLSNAHSITSSVISLRMFRSSFNCPNCFGVKDFCWTTPLIAPKLTCQTWARNGTERFICCDMSSGFIFHSLFLPSTLGFVKNVGARNQLHPSTSYPSSSASLRRHRAGRHAPCRYRAAR
jgi:hypothetical protein